MGEIAEMMLDGTLCEHCSVYTGVDEAPGYPCYCSKECAKDAGYSKKEIKEMLECGRIIESCDICGDLHDADSVPLSCQTGDGE